MSRTGHPSGRPVGGRSSVDQHGHPGDASIRRFKTCELELGLSVADLLESSLLGMGSKPFGVIAETVVLLGACTVTLLVRV